MSNGDKHTSAPMHAQDGWPSHAGGIGEHSVTRSCKTFAMHTWSSGQSAQLGTTSQISAGTQNPVQHDPCALTLGSVPAAHFGGNESHATAGLHGTGTSSQLPSSHCTSGTTPMASHAVWSHSTCSHGGGSAPAEMAVQLQQSSTIMQSLTPSQVVGAPPVDDSVPVLELSAPVLVAEDPVELELEPPLDDASVDVFSLVAVVSATPDEPEPTSVVAGPVSSAQPPVGHTRRRDKPKGLAAMRMGAR